MFHGESEKSCRASLANVLEENARLKKDFKDFYEKLEMDKEIKTEMGNLSLECKVIEPKGKSNVTFKNYEFNPIGAGAHCARNFLWLFLQIS